MFVDSQESAETFKYIMGNVGMEIFYAISRGARDKDMIHMFSGCPHACINARVPILMDLKIIEEREDGYYLTKKGKSLKKTPEFSSF